MHKLTRSVILELLSFSAVHNKKLFVVGGTLRDYLLLKPNDDFDFTGKNATEFGRSFSRHLNFTCIPLDSTPGRQTVRVILDQKQQLDFTDLQGRNIEEDLSQRDFTINALAIQLNDSDFGKLIDPFSGQKDLENKIIRTPLDPDITYSDDPLRMMRAIRFATQLDYNIEKKSFQAIKQNAKRLNIVSTERITDEFNKIMLCRTPSIGINLLFETGLLQQFFPEVCKKDRNSRINFSASWA